MRVAVISEIIPNMSCELCSHYWIAIIEATEIDWDSHKEILFKPDVQCPSCLQITKIYREEL